MVCSCNCSDMLTGMPREGTLCTTCTKKKRMSELGLYARLSSLLLAEKLKNLSNNPTDAALEAVKRQFGVLKEFIEKLP